MIVRADGSSIGSVGGGLVEANAITLALKMIAARKSAVQSFDRNRLLDFKLNGLIFSD